MKILSSTLESWVDVLRCPDQESDNVTYTFKVGDYKFVATFDVFQQFGILAFDGLLYKVIATFPNIANAISYYIEVKEKFEGVALIHF